MGMRSDRHAAAARRRPKRRLDGPRSLAVVGVAVLLAAIVSPEALAKSAHSEGKAPCDQPCTRASDCPKITCECDRGTATDVSGCDTEKTHCCASASDTCKGFCAANHQTWLGRFGPDAPPADSAKPSADGGSAAAESGCRHSCKEAQDCPTVSCECKHGTARDVAACGVSTKCCAEPRVVCDHFCRAQDDRWTGRLLDDAPADAPVLDDPDVDEE